MLKINNVCIFVLTVSDNRPFLKTTYSFSKSFLTSIALAIGKWRYKKFRSVAFDMNRTQGKSSQLIFMYDTK